MGRSTLCRLMRVWIRDLYSDNRLTSSEFIESYKRCSAGSYSRDFIFHFKALFLSCYFLLYSRLSVSCDRRLYIFLFGISEE